MNSVGLLLSNWLVSGREDFYFCCIQRPSLWHTLERQLKESVDTALSTWSRLMRFEVCVLWDGVLRTL